MSAPPHPAAADTVPGVSAQRPAVPAAAARRADLLSVLVLALVSVLVPVVHISVYQQLSPFDEVAHVDYALRAPGLVPTVSGDLWLQETMREAACRGVDRGEARQPDCQTLVRDPRTFLLEGYPSGYIHPPTYYDATAVVGRGIQRLLGLSSPVTGFRLVGALWLFAGLLSVFGAARRFGAARLPTVATLVLLTATPAVFYPASIVNPDGASLLVGGLGLWLVHRWDSGTSRTGPVPLLLAGALSTGIKNQNALVAGLFVLFLLAMALRGVPGWLVRGRPGPTPTDRLGRRVRGSVLLLAAAAVVGGAWVVTERAVATLPPAEAPMAEKFTLPELPAGAFRDSLGRFAAPLVPDYVPAQYAGGWLSAVFWAGTVVIGLGLLVTLVRRPRTPAVRVLAWSLLPVAVFGAVAEVLANWVLLHQYIGTTPVRYGLPLLPAFAVLTAAAVRSRLLGAGLAVLAGAAVVTTCTVLLASV